MHLSLPPDKVWLFSTVAAQVTWYEGEEWEWIGSRYEMALLPSQGLKALASPITAGAAGGQTEQHSCQLDGWDGDRLQQLDWR